jgi:hypothetical protein
MVSIAVSLFFFACRLGVETLGLIGFLNVRRSQICRGWDGTRRPESDGASNTAGNQNMFGSLVQE